MSRGDNGRVSSDGDLEVGDEREAVLVPHGEQMKTYGCLRSLNRRGIHTIVVSEADHVPNFSSRYCSERVRLSTDDLTSYKDALLELARRPEVKTILPVKERDAYLLANYRAEFAASVSLPVPDLATLRCGHDRLQLASEAAEVGVPMARTRRLSEVDRWDSDVVIKSRYNILTPEYVDPIPSEMVEEIKDIWFVEAGDTPAVESIRDRMKHDPIVQDFVPQADKYLYCALWEHGEPLATYQHRQIRQNSWVGGGGVYRKSVYSDVVDEIAYDLLHHLDWHGLACIEYLKDARTGEWKFLEINPRVWQSMPEAVRAGADFPYYYWLMAQGEQERIQGTYDRGVACHNCYGELSYLRSLFTDNTPYRDRPNVTKTLFDVFTSCLVHPRFEYVRVDDPGLLLSSLRQMFSSGVTPSRAYTTGKQGLHARR